MTLSLSSWRDISIDQRQGDCNPGDCNPAPGSLIQVDGTIALVADVILAA